MLDTNFAEFFFYEVRCIRAIRRAGVMKPQP
jgi:hypothetical protein